jgi:hypothetical protein
MPVVIASAAAAFAIWQLKKKRSIDYAAEQLAKFYAPMLGKLAELEAHRKFDEIVKRSNESAHTAIVRRDRDREITPAYVEEVQETTEQVRRFFEETLPRRFTHERVDMYVEMRRHFTNNLAHADEDTHVQYYVGVYEEVEKMRVYRDSPEEDFLPEGRANLASAVDMAILSAFTNHIRGKVEALKSEIKGVA